MEIRGKAWGPGELEPFTTITYVNSVAAADPIMAINFAYGRLMERLTKERTVQRSLTTYSMGPGEFDFIVNGVKEKALKEGRKEAWDLARRLITRGSDTYTGSEYDSVFGSHNANTIFGMPADDALALDKKYQEDKKTLHVGDEVEFTTCGTTKRGYVINVVSPVLVRVLTKDLGTYPEAAVKCKKTGKHNPDIEKAMASFEEGEGGQ